MFILEYVTGFAFILHQFLFYYMLVLRITFIKVQ